MKVFDLINEGDSEPKTTPADVTNYMFNAVRGLPTNPVNIHEKPYPTDKVLGDVPAFYQEYTNSPRYKEMLSNSIKQTPKDNTDYSKRNDALKSGIKTEVKPNVGSYYQDKKVTYDPSQSDKNTSQQSIIAHEIGHSQTGQNVGGEFDAAALIPRSDNELMANSLKRSHNVRTYMKEHGAGNNISSFIENRGDMHDQRPSEVRQNLMLSRYLLQKDKVFNPGTDKFTTKELQYLKSKYKNNYGVKTLLDNYKDADLINIFNTVSQNKQPDNKELEVQFAATGGIIKGKQGIDKVKAKVQAGSFIIPANNAKHPATKEIIKELGYTNDDKKGDIPVMLTDNEVIIHPDHIAIADHIARQHGLNSLNDLAPNAKVPNKTNAQGYATGGLVIGYDQNGDPIYDESTDAASTYYGTPETNTPQGQQNAPGQLQIQNPNPQVVPQAQANQIVQENEAQALMGNAENDAYKTLVPANAGSEQILSNSKKVQDMLGLTTPKMDEQKAERLKRIAGINAIGQALSTAFGSYIGTKGGPILNTASDITPKALAEYQYMVEKDKDNKYKTGLLQTQEAIRGMQEVAANELNNRRANQKVLADAQAAVSKFKLDRYQHNEEYRQKMDELAARNGFEWKKMLQENDWKEDAAKKAAANQLKIAWIHEAGANKRQELLYPNGKPRTGQSNYGLPDKLSFKPNGFGSDVELSNNQVGAMISAAKNDPALPYAIRKALMTATTPKGFNADALKIALPLLWDRYASYTVYKDGDQQETDNASDPDAEFIVK